MPEQRSSISYSCAEHAEMSSLELFALLGYFTRQMFHKPGLSKIKFSLEYIVFGARYPPEGEEKRSAVPGPVM